MSAQLGWFDMLLMISSIFWPKQPRDINEEWYNELNNLIACRCGPQAQHVITDSLLLLADLHEASAQLPGHMRCMQQLLFVSTCTGAFPPATPYAAAHSVGDLSNNSMF